MAAKSNVGVLTVFMDAITDQFHAGLNEAASAVDTFKGKLRGMNRGLSAAASAMRGAEVALDAFKAVSDLVNAETYEDINAAWVGIGDTLRSLPGPLGDISNTIFNIAMTLTGAREEMEKLAEATRQGQADTAAAEAALDKFLNVRAEIQKQTMDMAAGEKAYWQNVIDHGKEAADLGKRRLSHWEEHKKVTQEIMEAQFGVGKFEGLDEEYRKRLIKGLNHQLRVARELALIRDEALEVELATARAAEAAADRKKAADLAAMDRKKRLAELERATAELDRLNKKRAAVAARGVSSRADTFTSPMGTFSFPTMDDVVDISRKQLTELEAIDQSIRGVQDKISEIRMDPAVTVISDPPRPMAKVETAVMARREVTANVAPTAPPIARASVAPTVSPAMEAAERVKRLASEASSRRAAEADRVKRAASVEGFWRGRRRDQVKRSAGIGKQLTPKPPRMGAIKLPGLGSVAELGKKQLSQLEVIGTAVADVKTSITELSRA